MKKHLILLLIAIMFVACGNNKKSTTGTAQNDYDWMGSYTNDTITFILKDKGVCDVVTAKTTLPGCDYSWDVDGNNICIVDADHNIYLLEMHDGYMTSSTGSKFTKIK